MPIRGYCAKLVCSFLRDRDCDARNSCAGRVGDCAIQLGAIDLCPGEDGIRIMANMSTYGISDFIS
jgi:hypothetical protein